MTPPTWRELAARLGLEATEWCDEGHLRTESNTRINLRRGYHGRIRTAMVRCLDCVRVADPRFERMGVKPADGRDTTESWNEAGIPVDIHIGRAKRLIGEIIELAREVRRG